MSTCHPPGHYTRDEDGDYVPVHETTRWTGEDGQPWRGQQRATRQADEALTREWVAQAIRAAVPQGAPDKKAGGRVLKEVMTAHKGEVDGALAKRLVGEMLQQLQQTGRLPAPAGAPAPAAAAASPAAAPPAAAPLAAAAPAAAAAAATPPAVTAAPSLSSAVGLISEKDLTVGGEIAEGQFAVVVRAALWGQRVAVKQLKARDDAVRRAAVDASNPRRADETSRTRPTLLPHRETPSGPACRRRTGHRS